MASTYSTLLRVTLPTTGELSGVWGSTVNTEVTQGLESAIAGRVSIAMADANYTPTALNGTADEARNMVLRFTGTLTADRTITLPTAAKLYIVENATAGGFQLNVKTAAGTGVLVPNGEAYPLRCDGTNVVAMFSPRLDAVQSLLTGVSGVDTITASLVPALTAYKFGQEFTLIPVGVNTGAVTLNVNGLGAKAVTKTASVALVAGDLITGAVYKVIYDGTGFQITSISFATNATNASLVNGLNIGYREIPQNAQNAGYTAVLADGGKHIYMNTAGVYTIPANASVAFPIGTAITFVNMGAASTIAITTDTLRLAGSGTTGTRTLAQYGIATATKITSTSWLISGVGLT